MKVSPFHDSFAKHNVVFDQRFGNEIVASVSDVETEYKLIRDAVGITDASYIQCFKFPEEKGLDFLDSICAGNVAKLRFGRVLHTFLADENGDLIADCYIANNDEEFLLLCESIVDADALKKTLVDLGANDAGMEDLSASHAIISVDGYKAWSVAKDLFGSDVLGLPYLSVEKYDFKGENCILFRSGKTSEFGYLIVLPTAKATELFDACLESAKKVEGGLCGINIHGDLRLEGRFFNIFAEGAIVKDPLALGLQWIIDFNKEKFVGRDALFAKRDAGLTKKIIGISTDASVKMEKNAKIFNGSDEVATIVATCFSYVLNKHVGLALFNASCAYAGLSFTLGSAGGSVVETISMPPIMPKSLSVKLDDM